MKLTLIIYLLALAHLSSVQLVSAELEAKGSLSGPCVVNDGEIVKKLLRAGEQLIASGKYVSMSNLVGQLNQRSCALDLPDRDVPAQDTPSVISRIRPGVLVVCSLYQCGKCSDWHHFSATGFVLTKSGAFATCYHVVDQPDHAVMVVMTGDGRICGVRRVLAANEEHDVAILQLDGDDFVPLKLSLDAPVGSRVLVMSHPEGQYFTLTEGIVSRYFTGQPETGAATMMSITADFGPGSSGCPVFNEKGQVVAMADNIVAAESASAARMVFKNARPVQAIINLISRREAE